jgi:heme-degrading monooxygenase HmoA
VTFVVVWEFEPRPEAAPEFERAYGPEGVWTPFFRRAPDYLGTELLRDADAPSRYVTIDRWTSREAYDRFRVEHAAEYRAIDAACEGLTRHEALVGAFEVSDPASTSTG